MTSAYHHLSIHQDHRKYLGFAFHWESSQGPINRYFVYNQLPFGLCAACHIFTKLTRPLISYWRDHGINSFIYLDDSTAIFHSLSDATLHSKNMESQLNESGFQSNSDKSKWQPAQTLEWLGFSLNSLTMQILVNEAEIDKFLHSCTLLLNSKKITPRQVARVVGQITSMSRAIGPEARLMSRHLSYWVDDSLKNPSFSNNNINQDRHSVYSNSSQTFRSDSYCVNKNTQFSKRKRDYLLFVMFLSKSHHISWSLAEAI